MAKGIRLTSNSDYSNSAAAEMPPQWGLADGIIDNLILLARPRKAKRSLIDLSVSNSTFTDKNNVVFTNYGLVGDNSNGVITNVAEPQAFTAIVTMRINATADLTATGELAGMSSLANPPGTESDKGTLLGLAFAAPSGGTCALTGRIRIVVPAASPATTTRTIDIPIGVNVPVTQRTTSWYQVAVRVDPALEQIVTEQCGKIATRAVRQETAGIVSNRPRTGNVFQIATSPQGNTAPTFCSAEVCEVIITNNVLSNAALDAQYLLTKDGLSKFGQTLA